MRRPQYVSDAIETSAAGLHVGVYGPLRLHTAYQPIYRIGARELVIEAWEGLIRPTRDGLAVSPGELFEHVEPGDHLFVECMCRALHLRNYRNAGELTHDLFINVNPAIYESVEVIEREFDFMFSILGKYGLSPHRLVCELVEEEELSTDALVRVCALFRARGARVAMDDFGTGCSGPDRYAAIRPEVVKVDGAMFRTLSTERAGRMLLRSLAGTLAGQGSELLIEGIETVRHLSIAAEVGASLVQGYALAPPHILPHHFAQTLALPEQRRRFAG
jgi:EAL domain-containing protein (putative c-di-GMP-specific phosphodiesterase class I)